MTPIRKMTKEQRQAAILQAARKVFVEKGFHGTTSKQLAEAAGVSEALVFKHFPSKEALYQAILRASCEQGGDQAIEQLESVEPSTTGLVRLVWEFVSHILGSAPDEEHRLLLCLILRSLMEEGEFTRVALEGLPLRWVQKVRQCMEAAEQAGDMSRPIHPELAGWFVHHLVSGFMMHSLPCQPVMEYPLPRQQLIHQVVWFCLRGLGLREEAILDAFQKLGFKYREKAVGWGESDSVLAEANMSSASGF